MDIVQLQRHYIGHTDSMYKENFLDEQQFKQLQDLEDENNPDFVSEVVYLYFEDSERLLNDLTNEIGKPFVDFNKVAAHAHQFKGSSSSIGATRVKDSCVLFRKFCEDGNSDGCRLCLQQLKNEYFLVKSKLDLFFKMRQQIVAAGGSVPKVV